MNIQHNNPPREFPVNLQEGIVLKDCAHIELAPDEQVTFVKATGSEYDVAAKAWGYYATPSINGRLRRFNLRTTLVYGKGLLYVMLVDKNCEEEFHDYLSAEKLELLCWLDEDDTIKAVANYFTAREND